MLAAETPSDIATNPIIDKTTAARAAHCVANRQNRRKFITAGLQTGANVRDDSKSRPDGTQELQTCMLVGELLTRWLIRLALVCYAAALFAQLLSNNRPSILREARLAWTAGSVFLWAHLAAAFHFYHHWSHTLAFEDTARQTEELLGFAVGEGVYVNYLFAAVWTADAAYWWLAGLRRYAARPRWITLTVHAFLLFIVANATITFRTGATRWTAVAILLALAALAVVTSRRRR
jgi:hypothetical protein